VEAAANSRNGSNTIARRVSSWLEGVQYSQEGALIAISLAIGVGGGFGAVIFRRLISWCQHFYFVTLGDWLSFMGPYYVIVVPALGGLLVGPMIYFLAREAKGHGVPEVMEAVALQGGRMRPIVVVVKALASSICIGSGGSVGREGPIVQIGSAFGSTVGRLLRLPDDYLKNMVACGAAAGIAATFNSPIAGAIFALEIILMEFGSIQFATIVLASVTSSVIGRIFFGDVPAFPIPPYGPTGAWELPIYAVLGVVTAFAGFGFSRILYKFEDVFEEWRFPPYLKPAAGGLLVGLIGLWFPRVFGVGYGAIEEALHGQLALGTVLLLAVLKIVATSITIGSGGSGGVFAPSLYIGSMVGVSFGLVVHGWLPEGTAFPGAYAIVGMAAVFAAAAHAPITAMLIVFEMTQDYKIILPLMLATVISTLISQRLGRESIYTLKLIRRGIDLGSTLAKDVMQMITVSEAMNPHLEVAKADWPLERLAQEFARTRHHGFPVLDGDGRLFGVVSVNELEQAMGRAGSDKLTVADIAVRRPVVAYPDEPLASALRRMAVRDFGRLPVVSREDPSRLVGILRRQDILRAYNQALLRRAEAKRLLQAAQLEQVPGTDLIEVEVRPGSEADMHTVCELPLPAECVLVAVYRGDDLVIPRGCVSLQAGDRVVALVKREQTRAFQKLFQSE